MSAVTQSLPMESSPTAVIARLQFLDHQRDFAERVRKFRESVESYRAARLSMRRFQPAIQRIVVTPALTDVELAELPDAPPRLALPDRRTAELPQPADE